MGKGPKSPKSPPVLLPHPGEHEVLLQVSYSISASTAHAPTQHGRINMMILHLPQTVKPLRSCSLNIQGISTPPHSSWLEIPLSN